MQRSMWIVFMFFEIDPLLRWQSFRYDDKGRTLVEAMVDVTDGSTEEITRVYGSSGNENGLLRELTQSDTITTYDYDSAGRVIKTHKDSLVGTCHTSYNVYDAAGNVLASVLWSC